MTRRRRNIAFVLLLWAAVALVYFPAARYGFVSVDDPDNIRDNPDVHDGLSRQGIHWAMTSYLLGHWTPLTRFTYLVDQSLFHLQPGVMHVENIALHAAASSMLFLMLLAATGAGWRSAIVAALFAVHSMHTESVVWLTERRDVLSTPLLFAAVWAYIRCTQIRSDDATRGGGFREDFRTTVSQPTPVSEVLRRAGPSVEKPGSSEHLRDRRRVVKSFPGRLNPANASVWYLLALLLYILSLMSKAMGITLPALLLLIDFWPLERTGAENSIRSAGSLASRFRANLSEKRLASEPAEQSTEIRPPVRHENLVWLLMEKLPFAALAAIAAIVAILAQHTTGATARVDALPLSSRLGNIAVTFPIYILKLAVPINLAVFYPHPGDWPAAAVAAGAALLAGITLLALRHWKRRPYLAVGWLWFLVALLPVSGLAQSGQQSMADRYTYLPSVGLFVAIVWWIADLLSSAHRRAAGVMAGLVIAGFAIAAHQQVGYWRDSDTLFHHAIDATGSNWFAHWGLGNLARDRGDTNGAIDEFKRSLIDRPNPEANAGLGDCWRTHPGMAAKYYRAAVDLTPHTPKYRIALAAMLARMDQLDDAAAQLRAALKDDPMNADARTGLAEVSAKLRGGKDSRRGE